MKKCFKCGQKKRIGEFYSHPKMADGHLNKCKECTKSDVKLHRLCNLDQAHAYGQARAQNPERRAACIKYQRQLRKKNHAQYKARVLVARSIRSGRIVRPSACTHCLKNGPVEGHHEDYSKPLEVRWLCFKCHRELCHGHIVTAS